MFVPLPVLDPATQTTIDASFVWACNYWLSYQNIKQARYNMLDNNINNAFKFSPNPNLTGWNPLIEIIKIMDQFVTTYGWSTPIVLLQNDTLFCSVYVTIRMVTNSFQEQAVPIWEIFVFPNGDPHMVTGIPIW